MITTLTPEERVCCQRPPNKLVQQGLVLFNQQDFFAFHELLEDAWRQEPGPCRLLYQGILQLGVAFYHIQQQNPLGALKVLKRADAKLACFPERCQGIDVIRLRAICKTFRASLETDGLQALPPFPTITLKPT